jgi:galactose mutarotase-like enzyme
MTVGSFGRLSDGREVQRIVLGAEPGPVVHVLDLGATVHRVEVTGGDGRRRNVVLGHATAEDYRASTAYFGGTIGRYANRIAGGRFLLDGREVRLGVNDRGNHLHGGVEGFDKRLWTVVEHGPRHAVLALDSPDGDEGFPGELSVVARFEVSDAAVRIDYQATAEATTVVNLTNHAYFNLDGDGSGTVDGHVLRVLAERYTPVDGTGIPVGDHASVDGTPLDFRTATPLGAAVRRQHDQLASARGVDHNFVLDGSGWRLAAVLASPRTTTRLELRTDQPGLQVYTGNFLDGSARSSEGLAYRQGDGIALEPQLFPDSPNHPEYPSAVIAPGGIYRAALEWAFSALV